jgi:hypothetical protein
VNEKLVVIKGAGLYFARQLLKRGLWCWTHRTTKVVVCEQIWSTNSDVAPRW